MKVSFEWKTITVFIFALIGSLFLLLLPASSLTLFSGPALKILRIVLVTVTLVFLFERILTLELFTKILLGMILGVIAGLVFTTGIYDVKAIGTAFLRMIQMIVVPLVLASLLVGTASLGDPKKLGRIGAKTFAYYLSTTAIAICVGLILANIFQPGSGLSPEVQAQLMKNFTGEFSEKVSQMSQGKDPVETLLNIIPTNPLNSLNQGAMLQIIFFAIMIGVALTLIPKEKAQPVIAFFDGLNDVMIKIVLLAIKIAPYGVFALIADAVSSFGLEIIFSLFKYTLVVVGGLLILSFFYPMIARIFGGMKPMDFARGIRPAQIIAFSTSSSAATLPVTMEAAEDNLGVSNKIASFVLPLGATINMDGTALYQGVAAVFIAQVYGIPLGIGDQLIIVLTAILASIGTAAAPGVGLLMLVMILKQVGIPLEGVALILSVDRLLDMFRTTINVTSDACASVVVAASEGQLEEPQHKSAGI